MNYKNIFRLKQAIWSVFYIIEALIFFRFLLIAFNANPDSGFVHFVFEISDMFVRPFQGIFANQFGYGEYVIDMNLVLAMVVYYIVAWIATRLLVLMRPLSDSGVQ